MRVELERINLLKLPEAKLAADYNLAVMGDMHGCSLKLLYVLLQEAAEMTLQQFDAYAECYQADKYISLPDLKLRQTQTQMIFLGDDLADRGVNDAMTLDLFLWMHQQKLPFHVLLSNHSLVFLEYISKLAHVLDDEKFEQFLIAVRADVARECEKHGGQIRSLNTFINLPDDNLIEYVKGYSEYYLSHLKLIDYCVDSNGYLILFSHAPTYLPVIEMLAKGYKVWPKQFKTINKMTRFDLENLIDALNQAFRNSIDSFDFPFFNEMLGSADIAQTKLRAANKLKYGGLALLTWNRDYKPLLKTSRLHQLQDAEVKYVHGHDNAKVEDICHTEAEEKVYYNHYVNLDNDLGKGLSESAFAGDNPMLRIEDFSATKRSLSGLLVKMS